jgi:multiple antibiotic resistance protein
MVLDSSLAFFIAALTSLFVIVNPFSTVTVFLTIARGDSKKKKKLMAKRATVTGAAVLIIFALAGSYILGFFSITIEAFRIAGGILVASVGWSMISTGKKHLPTEKEKMHAIKKEDVSIIPLAIPMLAGPGSITTSIVLVSEATGILDIISILIAIVIVMAVSYFVLIKGDTIDNFLGETGRRVADRIMGLIVMVVGVQFIINGVVGIVLGWPILG